MLRRKFKQPTILDGAATGTAGWRGLQLDQIDGQLTGSVVAPCLRFKRMPVVVWRSTTGDLQVANAVENHTYKALLRSLQDNEMIHPLADHPDHAPVMRRQNVVNHLAHCT